MRRLLGIFLVFLLSHCTPRGGVTAECVFNSDCVDGLICVGSYCRSQCVTDRDCTNNWLCRPSPQHSVCVAPDDPAPTCIYSTDCPTPKVCTRQGVCAFQCRQDYDCQLYDRTARCVISTDGRGTCSTNPTLLLDAGTYLDSMSVPPCTPGEERSCVPSSCQQGMPCTNGVQYCTNSGVFSPCIGGGSAVACEPGQVFSCITPCVGGMCAGQRFCDNIGLQTPCFLSLSTPCNTTNNICPVAANVQRIATGATFGCATFGSTMGLYCWGQIGSLTLPRPTLMPGTDTEFPGSFVAGGSHICWISQAGLRCVGSNNNGQCGVDPAVTPEAFAPVTVNLPFTPRGLTAGESHTCAHNGAEVYCWGSNRNVQLGSMAPGASSFTPTAVANTGAGAIQRLEAGGDTTCVLRSVNSLFCWGDNRFNQQCSTAPSGAAVNVTIPSAITAASMLMLSKSSHDTHMCIGNPNNLSCCGGNSRGQITGDPTDGEMISMFFPIEMNTKASIGSVALGAGTTCYSYAGNISIYCRGDNQYGQCGENTITNPNTVGFSMFPASGVNSSVNDISAGNEFNCATDSNGTARCWGRNTNQQLGLASSISQTHLPTPIVDPFSAF